MIPNVPVRIYDFMVAMAILLGLSSLPFLNEIVTQDDGSLQNWLVSAKTQESWKSENGRILGYSKLRVLLYYLLIQLYILIASLGWFSVAKGKYYRNAILVCSASAFYHILIILTESRKTFWNEPKFKLWGTLGISILLFGLYIFQELWIRRKLRTVQAVFGDSPKKLIVPRVVMAWVALVGISTFSYFHDIISPRGMGVQDWVPFGGLENLVKLGEKDFLGFTSYRALVLTVFVQLSAQSMWAGWWMDARYSLYKPFLLVPLGLSFYQIVIILMVKTDTYLNKPDIKLYITLTLCTFIGLIYYFKNKGLQRYEQESITSVVPQNKDH